MLLIALAFFALLPLAQEQLRDTMIAPYAACDISFIL